jgi:hypothetical protein
MLGRPVPPVRLSPLCPALALALALALTGGGCAGSRAASPEVGSGARAAASIEQTLLPAELDPAADKYLAPQFAYLDPPAPRAAHLVVYLVGANNKPDRGRTMARFLAGLGFPVVVPGYANDYDIRGLCGRADTADPECHGKLRLEAFEGIDHSPHIVVTPPNSLEARVARMLAALDRQQPEAGWSKFLSGDRPRWTEIIVAGHSHGASSAALIGKVRPVHRVVMLSGPFDNRAGEPAPWTRQPPATPADRFYGFSHTQEEQHAGHVKDWDALGLPPFGAPVAVESSGPPYASSHQLITSLAPAGGTNYHGTTAAGNASPRLADGSYRFTDVWRYLFGL